MIDNNFAILQFDKEKDALLNPQDMNSEKKKINKNCILCFFDNVLKELEDSKEITVVETLNSPLGSHKIYELKYKDTLINLFNPGLGGPMAAGFLEELISLGSENFIACGGAGVLVSSIEMGQLIVPTTAIIIVVFHISFSFFFKSNAYCILIALLIIIATPNTIGIILAIACGLDITKIPNTIVTIPYSISNSEVSKPFLLLLIYLTSANAPAAPITSYIT